MALPPEPAGLVKWYNYGLQNRCRGFDSLTPRTVRHFCPWYMGMSTIFTFRLVLWLSTWSFIVLSTVFAAEVVRKAFSVVQAYGFWLAGIGALAVMGVSYVAADFISGVVHWIGDQFGDEKTPFFGPHFVFPFRHHHVDPLAITRHSFTEVNGLNCLASLIVMIPVFVFFRTSEQPVWWFLGLGFLTFLAAIFLTNQIHKWAHMPTAPRFVRFLQRHRLILSPEHHNRHHTAPFDTFYCITVGWLNPLIERFDVFARIEKLIAHKHLQR